jgi:hypothetical protein
MRHPRRRRLPLALASLRLASVLPALAQTTPKPAVPLDPISANLDAFKTIKIVALGEGVHKETCAAPPTPVRSPSKEAPCFWD